jgi:hypothetical protein
MDIDPVPDDEVKQACSQVQVGPKGAFSLSPLTPQLLALLAVAELSNARPNVAGLPVLNPDDLAAGGKVQPPAKKPAPIVNPASESDLSEHSDDDQIMHDIKKIKEADVKGDDDSEGDKSEGDDLGFVDGEDLPAAEDVGDRPIKQEEEEEELNKAYEEGNDDCDLDDDLFNEINSINTINCDWTTFILRATTILEAGGDFPVVYCLASHVRSYSSDACDTVIDRVRVLTAQVLRAHGLKFGDLKTRITPYLSVTSGADPIERWAGNAWASPSFSMDMFNARLLKDNIKALVVVGPSMPNAVSMVRILGHLPRHSPVLLLRNDQPESPHTMALDSTVYANSLIDIMKRAGTIDATPTSATKSLTEVGKVIVRVGEALDETPETSPENVVGKGQMTAYVWRLSQSAFTFLLRRLKSYERWIFGKCAFSFPTLHPLLLPSSLFPSSSEGHHADLPSLAVDSDDGAPLLDHLSSCRAES